jgi:site-specific DNA-methyltransferase (adenine-specific)
MSVRPCLLRAILTVRRTLLPEAFGFYNRCMNVAPHFSSQTDEWATPPEVFARLDAEFGFTLDPCATPENATCLRYFTRETDGLAQDWSGEVVFMNPPYGRAIGLWIQKAHQEAQRGATVVCLIPARTDTAYWHDYCMRGEIRFLRGRLKFGEATNSAPFPSAVVIFRPNSVVSPVFQQMTLVP